MRETRFVSDSDCLCGNRCVRKGCSKKSVGNPGFSVRRIHLHALVKLCGPGSGRGTCMTLPRDRQAHECGR